MNETKILFNNDEIYQKHTPYLISEHRVQNYDIIINNNNLNIIIDNKFNLIKCILPINR